MSFRYGFTRDSRQMIEEELGFSQEELTDIEERAGFSLSNTFDVIRETAFDSVEGETTVSKGAAVTKPERTVSGVDVVLEYEEMDAGTLAHEAAHASMMQPDGMVVSELPDDDLASQRVYGEFVAHLAEHRVDPLETGGEEAWQVLRAEREYGRAVDREIEEAYEMAVSDEGLTAEEWDLTMEYQDVREQALAAVAAESYDEERDVATRELLSPDEELYEETMAYIENVADRIHEYA